MANRASNGKFIKKETIQMSDNGTAEVKPMLTLSQSVEYLKGFDPKINKTKLTAILANQKYSAIFTPDSVKVTHFHPEVPDLIEVDPNALQAFIDAKQAGKVGNRATRQGRDRKYTIYISDARIVEFQSLVSRAGFSEALPAYKAKTATTSNTPVETVAIAPDEIEELISA